MNSQEELKLQEDTWNYIRTKYPDFKETQRTNPTKTRPYFRGGANYISVGLAPFDRINGKNWVITLLKNWKDKTMGVQITLNDCSEVADEVLMDLINDMKTDGFKFISTKSGKYSYCRHYLQEGTWFSAIDKVLTFIYPKYIKPFSKAIIGS
jgi:hypothetical protein